MVLSESAYPYDNVNYHLQDFLFNCYVSQKGLLKYFCKILVLLCDITFN